MESHEIINSVNPLESESIGKLILKYSLPAIGKGGVGTVVSLSRQVFFLLPMVLLFPLICGIDGELWAGPIADGVSGAMGLLLVRREMRKW